MIAENYATSIVTQLPLLDNKQMPQGYYRSKLFIVPFTTNPLVTAAWPVLSLLERLYIAAILPPINSIRDNIEHELRAFYSHVNSKVSGTEIDTIAYYLLCATIDELLAKNYLRLYGKLTEFHAFTPPAQDNVGPEQRFFDIVAYIKERPNQYLDLLELAYYCLIIGFEGIEHGRANGRQILDNLLEELYQLIKQHRVNKTHRLFTPPQSMHPISVRTKSQRPLIVGAIISLLILTGSYCISHTLLEHQAQNIQLRHLIATGN